MSITGAPASSLLQYSVSLQSFSTFIATLNINSTSLRGEWKMMLAEGNTYDVVIYAISDLSFSSKLFRFDPTSSFGFSAIVGKPLSGM